MPSHHSPNEPDPWANPEPDYGSTHDPPPSSVETDVTASEYSPDNQRTRQAFRSARKLYLILLVIGLAVGALISVGVVSLLDRFGLTDEPAPVESEP